MLLFVCGRARAGERLEPEPARAALAGLLAAAPFLPADAVRTWAAPSGRAVVAWAGEGVHVEDDACALFSGRPIRWTGDETADGREPLDPAGYLRDPREWAPDLDGRWAAAAYDEGSGVLRVAADALGAHPLFSAETADGALVRQRAGRAAGPRRARGRGGAERRLAARDAARRRLVAARRLVVARRARAWRAGPSWPTAASRGRRSPSCWP